MLPNSCKHIPLGKEKRQYNFLLQPLNLTTRNSSPQTSTPQASAAVGSLNTLTMVTTFLTNALTRNSTNDLNQSQMFRRATSKRAIIISPALSMQVDGLFF